MNSKELITSGIVELYCLGIASEEEQLLVEQLSKNDPLVKEEIAAVNEALTNFATAVTSIRPPEHFKQQLIATIQQSASLNGTLKLPPKLTAASKAQEWLDYLETEKIKEPVEEANVKVVELPGTEDYYTYVVFGSTGGIVDEELHTGHDEYLLICQGTCEMIIDGKKSSYGAGDIITIKPGIAHSAVITGKERMIVIGQRRAA